MAPKAKGKAKAAAKAKGKAMAKAMAVVRGRLRPGRGGGVMNRPAGAGGRVLKRPATRVRDGAGEDPVADRWRRGETVKASDLDPRDLMGNPEVVMEDGSYFQKQCRAAGKITGCSFEGSQSYAKMKVEGTQEDGLLQYLTGQTSKEMRVHLCGETCSGETVADDLLHCKLLRKQGTAKQEEAWTNNLEAAHPVEREDELEALRLRGLRDLEGRVGAAALDRSKEDGKDDKKDKKKDKKEDKKEKKKDKKKKKKEESEDSKEEESGTRVDGSHAKTASVKSTRALFRGTGLDPKDRVRNRVARHARRHLKRKTAKASSTSSGGTSSSDSGDLGDQEEETLMGQSSKVRIRGDRYSGALSNQALMKMRSNLAQEIGLEDRENQLIPVALAYYRQHLARRASGPAQRELLTLSTAIDHLLRGRTASAMDAMIQRLKSIEQTMSGCHYTVAQRQEICGSEQVGLTSLKESSEAQREVYQEARMRWAAQHAEGRAPKFNQEAKGKNDKGRGKGQGKDKNSKGGGNKGDGGKKKDQDKWGLKRRKAAEEVQRGL